MGIFTREKEGNDDNVNLSCIASAIIGQEVESVHPDSNSGRVPDTDGPSVNILMRGCKRG